MLSGTYWLFLVCISYFPFLSYFPQRQHGWAHWVHMYQCIPSRKIRSPEEIKKVKGTTSYFPEKSSLFAFYFSTEFGDRRTWLLKSFPRAEFSSGYPHLVRTTEDSEPIFKQDMHSPVALSFHPEAIGSLEITHQTPGGTLRNQHVKLLIYIRNIITKETRTFLSPDHRLFLPEILSERLNLCQQFILWNKWIQHSGLWLCVCFFLPAGL